MANVIFTGGAAASIVLLQYVARFALTTTHYQSIPRQHKHRLHKRTMLRSSLVMHPCVPAEHLANILSARLLGQYTILVAKTFLTTRGHPKRTYLASTS